MHYVQAILPRGRITLLGAVVVFLALVLALPEVLHAQDSARSQQQPSKERDSFAVGPTSIRVLVLLPLSGEHSAAALEALAGIEYAKRSSKNPERLELLYEDTGCSADTAVSSVQDLLITRSFDVVLGGICQQVASALAPILEKERIPLVLLLARSSGEGTYTQVYSFEYDFELEQRLLARYLTNSNNTDSRNASAEKFAVVRAYPADEESSTLDLALKGSSAKDVRRFIARLLQHKLPIRIESNTLAHSERRVSQLLRLPNKKAFDSGLHHSSQWLGHPLRSTAVRVEPDCKAIEGGSKDLREFLASYFRQQYQCPVLPALAASALQLIDIATERSIDIHEGIRTATLSDGLVPLEVDRNKQRYVVKPILVLPAQ